MNANPFDEGDPDDDGPDAPAEVTDGVDYMKDGPFIAADRARAKEAAGASAPAAGTASPAAGGLDPVGMAEHLAARMKDDSGRFVTSADTDFTLRPMQALRQAIQLVGVLITAIPKLVDAVLEKHQARIETRQTRFELAQEARLVAFVKQVRDENSAAKDRMQDLFYGKDGVFAHQDGRIKAMNQVLVKVGEVETLLKAVADAEGRAKTHEGRAIAAAARAVDDLATAKAIRDNPVKKAGWLSALFAGK